MKKSRKCYVLCGKTDENAINFWILGIFTSKKRALIELEYMNNHSRCCYHYIFEEELE